MPQDVFEKYAEDYDRWFDEHQDEFHAELARIRQVFPQPVFNSIEVGVGSGRFAASLGITIGVEPSRALGRIARQRGIEVIRGRGESIPIKNGSCSSVLMVTVICFLDDPEATFREISRILVRHGTLVLGFLEREGQVARKYLQEKGKHRFLSHARFYSHDEVLVLLNRTGFHAIKVDCRVGFCVIAAQKP